MRLVRMRVSGLMLATLAVAAAQQLSAQQNGSGGTPTLEERVDELDQQIRILQRLRELAADSAADRRQGRPPRPTPARTASASSRPTANYSLRFRGLHPERRALLPEQRRRPGPPTTCCIRRARPILEATVGRYFDFRLMPDFGGTSPAIFDAYWEGKFVARVHRPGRQVQAAGRPRAAPVGHRHHLRRARLSDQPRAQPRHRSPGRGRHLRRRASPTRSASSTACPIWPTAATT